jgi:hypothetical protein
MRATLGWSTADMVSGREGGRRVRESVFLFSKMEE